MSVNQRVCDSSVILSDMHARFRSRMSDAGVGRVELNGPKAGNGDVCKWLCNSLHQSDGCLTGVKLLVHLQ
jgi:hypothetical protein